MRLNLPLTCPPGWHLSVAGLCVSVFVATGHGQDTVPPDHPSHRTLAPDSARIQELMARAELLSRLQSFVGNRNQLPGISSPEQQQYLKQIMQQMTMSLAESGIQLPGQGRGGSRKNSAEQRPPVDFSSRGNRKKIQRYLESISGSMFDRTDRDNELRNPFSENPQEPVHGDPPLPGDPRFDPPDRKRTSPLPQSSPFDDVTDPDLSLT
ncbi:MAG: hypothetical protein VB858_03730, partial [Planctomycetaceae bacterium]